MFNPDRMMTYCPSEFHCLYHGEYDNTGDVKLPVGHLVRRRGNYINVDFDNNDIYLAGNGVYRIITSVVFTTNETNNYNLYLMVDDRYSLFHVTSENEKDSSKLFASLSQDCTVGVDDIPHASKLSFYLEGSDCVVNFDVDIVKL